MTVFRNVYELDGKQYTGAAKLTREAANYSAELAATRGIKRIALIREHQKQFIQMEPVWL